VLRKSERTTGEVRKHHVYVVELNPKVLERSKFQRANPGYEQGKDCLYVGMTGLTPEERFANHRKGHKASRIVRDFGQKLRPELYSKYNPLSRKEAEKLEVELAEELREEGHAVWQN
jgi:hypothetical protein